MKFPFKIPVPHGKWRWALLGLGGVVVLGLFTAFGEDTKWITETVQEGPLSQEVSVTGSVESDTMVDLRFASTGNVEEILVLTGEEVQKGQRLLSLNLDKLEAELSRASAGVRVEEAELNLMLAGPTDQEVALSFSKIEEAEINLENAETEYDNVLLTNAESIRQAELEVSKAQDANDTAVMEQSNTGEQIASDLETAYENSQPPAEDALDALLEALIDVDLLLGVDDGYLDPDFETEIKDTDSDFRIFLRNAYYDLREEHPNLETQAQSFYADWSGEALELFLDDLENAIEYAKQMVDAGIQALEDMEQVDASTQSNIDSLILTLQTDQSTLSTVLNALQTAISAIRDANIGTSSSGLSADSEVTVADANLGIAQSQFETVQVEATVNESNALMNIEVMKSRLDQRQAEHDELIAPPREVDLASQRARLAQAKASYSRALAEWNDAILYAPANGLVAKVNVDPGQSVSNADVALNFITDQLQVKANISETEIALVSLGDPVQMTLDAFDIDQIFTGTVVAIDPAETVVQGVVYYQATVLFDESYEGIRSGMTVNLDILTDEKEATLYVSSQALQFEDGETFVFVLSGEEKIRRVVKTGIQSDRYVEILSGLEQGEEVLLYEQ